MHFYLSGLGDKLRQTSWGCSDELIGAQESQRFSRYDQNPEGRVLLFRFSPFSEQSGVLQFKLGVLRHSQN